MRGTVEAAINFILSMSIQFVFVCLSYKDLKKSMYYCSFQVQKPEDILNASRLIFPGVGAFAAAIDVLNQNG